MSNNTLWKTKLAAWIHDPAEKALILLRDKEGHEWGTARRLRDELDIPYNTLSKTADWYASAADRPQFPTEGKRFARWTQVDFAAKPELKHPLTGTTLDLGKLDDIHPEHLKALSTDHFKQLMVKAENSEGYDWQKTLLNFWRFAPDLDAAGLGLLWRLLPADTRVPDHTIWEHLDIVSAFAGAMEADEDSTPALLSVSFGPIQGFIAEARSTSDLWAGSHLLARIAWEGMKVVCERLGPDAVLFPNLRGVPLVDVWLRDEMGLPPENFEREEWARVKTDANPLFAAALPNRFVALVPADQAQAIAQAIEEHVREFVHRQGENAIQKMLEAVKEPTSNDLPCYQQLDEQLQGFPEVYWAAVPWSLAGRDKTAEEQTLRPILSNFYEEGAELGFLDGEAWKVLQKDIELEGAKFYSPNPGVLYPVLYDLLDRVAAASKSARPFDQLRQEGYRSSMNGEREWLTLDRTQLTAPSGQRKDTLWSRLADAKDAKPGWAKKGEHLDALNAIKRLWPTLVAEEVGDIIGAKVNRYVVSTHTLALAVSLDKWLDNPQDLPLKLKHQLEVTSSERTALPSKLMAKLRHHPDAELLCRKLPGVLDLLKEQDDRQSEAMLAALEGEVKSLFGAKPEAYYGMILLDGDKMGAWVSGDPDKQIPYQACWHSQIVNSGALKQLVDKNADLQAYLQQKRSASPARHRAISEALNQFSIRVARFVVEECFKGKLIYSGGDDVLAFVCVDDLLPAMTLLRYLYSGRPVPDWIMARLDERTKQRFNSKNGYLFLDGKLLLTMGEKAEASCGAIVAHHQTPLGYVLRQLRAAESQAKNAGGRNAFSFHVLKRGGGAISVTDKWEHTDRDGDPIDPTGKNAPELLDKVLRMLAHDDVSRRAAYHSLTWLKQLPPTADVEMLKTNLAYQFGQQGHKDDRNLAYELAVYVFSYKTNPAAALENMLMVAEFLARESRNTITQQKEPAQ